MTTVGGGVNALIKHVKEVVGGRKSDSCRMLKMRRSAGEGQVVEGSVV